LEENRSDLAIALKAQQMGVECEPLSAFYLGRKIRQGLISGYAPFRRKEIKEGISSIARLIQ
jgi:DNA-binding transcriptional MocR family regulator